MISPADTDRLEDYLSGRLTRAEAAALEAELVANPALAKALVALAYEDAVLAKWASAGRVAGTGAGARPGAPRARLVSRRRALGAAAAVLAAASVWWLVHLVGGNGARPGSDPHGGTVAVLSRSVGAVWGAGARAPAPGDEVAGGPLRLESGVAQFDMRGGATVVIEGPAEFDLRGPGALFCRRGRLRARLAGPPHDFRVETPACAVVDRGTEFGVEVDPAGATEVHVFEGAVEVTGAGQATPLRAGRGVRVPAGKNPEGVAFRGDEFLGSRELDQLLNREPGSPADRWLAHSKQLRGDPRVLLYYPFDGPAPADGRVRNHAAGGDRGPDGTIAGCRWAEGRWPGKSALEFRAPGDGIRVNVPDPLGSFTLAAWVRVDRLDRVYNGLLLSDGWDHGALHWQLDWRGQLIVAGGGMFWCTSPPVVAPDQFGHWLLLVATRDARTGTVTQYVNGRAVVTARGESTDPVRIGSARLGDWAPPADARNPVRTLAGRLDELLIVRAALTGAEVRAMYHAGRPGF